MEEKTDRATDSAAFCSQHPHAVYHPIKKGKVRVKGTSTLICVRKSEPK